MPSPIEKKNYLLEGARALTSKQKRLFKYFGVDAKIKPPYRILNPQRFVIGDRTSIQEHAHMNAFIDLRFLMEYMEKKHRASFKADDYQYDPAISINRECQIGRFFFMTCTRRIEILSNVLISERVFIGDNNHTASHPEVPIMQQPNQRGEAVKIGAGSWIGLGAVILKGTSLGTHSVVGANSVVQGSFPAGAVLGSPQARLLYVRK